MGEVLSQKEIDELLRSLNEGTAADLPDAAAPGQKIRNYDFRTANRIPRDQMKSLHSIYENFARSLATYLTGTLGVLCDANVISLEEQTFQEYANSTPPSSLLAILKMKPLDGPTLLQLSPEIAYAILECLLGGSGMPAENRRIFTEIDLVILEKVVRQFLALINGAWDKIVKVTAELDGIETSTQFAQIVQPGETIVIVTIGVKVGTIEAPVIICLPQVAIEPIARNLNPRLLAVGRTERRCSENHQDNILDMLGKTQVSITAILSETSITVSELVNLQAGDVIQLESRLSDRIVVKIGHIRRLEGILGSRSNHYAIKVTGTIYEEEATYE